MKHALPPLSHTDLLTLLGDDRVTRARLEALVAQLDQQIAEAAAAHAVALEARDTDLLQLRAQLDEAAGAEVVGTDPPIIEITGEVPDL